MPPQLDYVVSAPTIRTVILLHRGPWHIEGTDLYYRTRSVLMNVRRPEGHDRRAIYVDALTDALKRFSAAGKRVLLVIDAPEFSYDPKRCVDLVRPFASPFRERPDCRLPRKAVDARNQNYLQISAAAVAPFANARVINLQDALCDDHTCYGIREGKLLYRDADHLNSYGAEYVISRLWREFEATADQQER